ncbi:MAG TPA: PilZ domain-containing protein [Candidatus Binatus sp.]|nr:PilZ domain-containing protein [Candidatus Binatus sp.]
MLSLWSVSHNVRDYAFSIVPEPYGNKNVASHMDRRAHRRVPAQLQGFLLGNSHEIEAVTLDLSIGGARFDCDLEVFPGKVIRVRLVIPGAEELVSIEDARVQWVGEDTFGVSFRNIRPDELDELEQLIDEYEETEDSGHA